ncbi:hypothetical protein, partial [Serratia fonticola]
MQSLLPEETFYENGFRNQLIALPQVFRGLALYGFTGPAVKRIIGVGGYLPVRIGPLYQPVPTVIGKG